MILRRRDKARKGAAAVEGAVVYPSFFALLFMLVIGGMGIFHYQMCAFLASESVRFACVRGKSWAKETGQPSPTQQQIFDQCVAPGAVGMNLKNLSIALVVIDPASGSAVNWDTPRRSSRTSCRRPARKRAPGPRRRAFEPPSPITGSPSCFSSALTR